MGRLSHYVENTSYQWKTSVYLDYDITYDASTNKSTITFTNFNTTYWGVSGYYTTITEDITVSAVDNTSSSGTSSLKITGTTNGGSKTFSGVPSPASITVSHAAGAGDKQVKIESTAKIYAAMTGSGTQAYANGSGSIIETSGTFYSPYTITLTASNSTITAKRISSAAGASIGNLANKATIYQNDVIQFTFKASAGYMLTTHTVNGTEFISGNSYTVVGDTAVVASASLKPSVDAISPIIWIAEIWDGTQWKLYQPGVQKSGDT